MSIQILLPHLLIIFLFSRLQRTIFNSFETFQFKLLNQSPSSHFEDYTELEYSRSDLDSTGNLDSSVESTHDIIPSKLAAIGGNNSRQRDDSSGSDGYTTTSGTTKTGSTKKNSNSYNTAYVSKLIVRNFLLYIFYINVLPVQSLKRLAHSDVISLLLIMLLCCVNMLLTDPISTETYT